VAFSWGYQERADLLNKRKVCSAVGLLATIWYTAINRKTDVAIVKQNHFDLACVFEMILK